MFRSSLHLSIVHEKLSVLMLHKCMRIDVNQSAVVGELCLPCEVASTSSLVLGSISSKVSTANIST